MPADDPAEDVTLPSLRLVGAAYTSELAQVITASGVERKLDGGSTLDLTVADYRRLLIKSNTIAGKAYAEVSGLRYELVGVKKTGNGVNLTFEDSIVAELKRPRTKFVVPASTQTRQQIARRLADEANVRIQLDPEKREPLHKALERDDNGSSWDLLQTLASDIGWRCFSDGWQLFFGSDAWLSTLTHPLPLREGDPVLASDIDFDMDVAEPASSASFDVHAQRWSLPPGRCIRLSQLGWADGDWLVSSFSRSLTSNRAKVELTRRQLVLAEPPPETTGESGEEGFLPEGSGDITADLARLRQCESGGNYTTNTGNGYYGAYQFDVSTWRELGFSGMPHQASPATQDDAARKLYAKRGWKPWPACSKKLGLVDRRSSSSVTGTSISTGNAGRDRMISWAMSRRGKPYAWGKANDKQGYDCSGFVRTATRAAGKELSGNSKAQFATCRAQGKLISVDQALQTRGAILFRMKGDPTHVAISLGDGSTIEARGTAYGCNVFAKRGGWTNGAIWI